MNIETIIFTILFVGPGFFIQILEDELYSNSNRFDTNEKYVVKAFIDSFILLLINMFFIKKLFKLDPFLFSYFVSKFDSIDFFIEYIGLTFLTSAIYTLTIKRVLNIILLLIKNCFKNTRVKDFFMKIINKIYDFLKFPVRETTFPTIWESIFCDNLKDFIGKVITIEKDGKIISCGYLGEAPGINSDIKELKLVETNEISQYMFDEDFTQFYIETIEFEYYDFDSCTLLKCYKLKDDAFNRYKEDKMVLQKS